MTTQQPSLISTPDLSDYRAGHDAMRQSAEQLVRGVAATTAGDRRRIAALRRWTAGFCGELRGHHHNEDEIFFPALAAKVPSYQEYDAAIIDDHARLHSVLEGLEAAMRGWTSAPTAAAAQARALAAAVALRDLLGPHLDFEDADILPMFERHLSVEEYADLNQRMLKQVDVKQACFTVPWFMSRADEHVREAMWNAAPFALKMLHRLTRGKHRRLESRAFGDLRA
jgi:hemerythrin-like domain-containing protein